MRRYDTGSRIARNLPENPKKCIVEVNDGDWHRKQCGRLRGHGPKGLYCKQHGKMAEQGRYLNIPEDNEDWCEPTEKIPVKNLTK